MKAVLAFAEGPGRSEHVLVQAVLLAALRVARRTLGRAVVAAEDRHRLVPQAQFVEGLEDPSDLPVELQDLADVVPHPGVQVAPELLVGGELRLLVGVGEIAGLEGQVLELRGERGRRVHWVVGAAEPHVHEEGAVLAGADEPDGLVGDLGVAAADVLVVAAEDFDLVEPVGPRLVLRAEVPFAEVPGGVAAALQQVADGERPAETEPRRVLGEAGREAPGHEAGAARAAGGPGDVEPAEEGAVGGEAVDLRRLGVGMAGAAEIPVAEVVGQQEHDVGGPGRAVGGGSRRRLRQPAT